MRVDESWRSNAEENVNSRQLPFPFDLDLVNRCADDAILRCDIDQLHYSENDREETTFLAGYLKKHILARVLSRSLPLPCHINRLTTDTTLGLAIHIFMRIVFMIHERMTTVVTDGRMTISIRTSTILYFREPKRCTNLYHH